MKEIKAYIRPEKVDNVMLALEDKGIRGMTLINVNAIANWSDPEKSAFSVKYIEKYSKIVKLELICPSASMDDVVNAILENASTGRRGDGKIFVSDIDSAVSIRTGLRGLQAI